MIRKKSTPLSLAFILGFSIPQGVSSEGIDENSPYQLFSENIITDERHRHRFNSELWREFEGNFYEINELEVELIRRVVPQEFRGLRSRIFPCGVSYSRDDYKFIVAGCSDSATIFFAGNERGEFNYLNLHPPFERGDQKRGDISVTFSPEVVAEMSKMRNKVLDKIYYEVSKELDEK